MAASGWSYFVPYQPDVQQAFKELCEQVFREGKYESLTLEQFKYEQDYRKQALEDEYSLDDTEYYEEAINNPFFTQDASKPPQSIEELLIRNEPDGTHTILDMYHGGISEEPGFGKLTLLKDKMLLQIFGTTKPNRDMVLIEDRKGGASRIFYFNRWEGIYFYIYENETPTEIYFAGISGD